VSASSATGASVVSRSLRSLGVRVAFGLPGTQNMDLLEAFHAASIRFVCATHELGAAFMANGYYRASGRPAALVTIPGPGLTYAATGLAEALHDSAALLALTTSPRSTAGKKFGLQAIDQPAVAGPLVKAYLRVERASEIRSTLMEAYRRATGGEPGPVVVEFAQGILEGPADGDPRPAEPWGESPPPLDEERVARAADMLAGSRRPLLFLGQGAASAHQEARALAERLGAVVVTTCSGRGVLPEAHPRVLALDQGRGGSGLINGLLARADAVLAVGCKWTHSGSYGYTLELPPEKLIHVDASSEVAGVNYPARVALVSDARLALEEFLRRVPERVAGEGGWDAAEIEAWKGKVASEKQSLAAHDPRPPGDDGPGVSQLVRSLQAALPRARFVTDSGLHQFMVRGWFEAREPRSLIAPVDFQSMGFGIAAGIGAALADPEREVVVVVGDGGFVMSGMEILTAVREGIPLVVAVFVDGGYGLIRRHQIGRYGRAPGSEVLLPDLAGFAASAGVPYLRYDPGAGDRLRGFLSRGGVRLLEVPLREPLSGRTFQVRQAVKGIARRAIGGKLLGLWRNARREN
jgi:acetolactate synthase I/II/III large subunit